MIYKLFILVSVLSPTDFRSVLNLKFRSKSQNYTITINKIFFPINRTFASSTQLSTPTLQQQNTNTKAVQKLQKTFVEQTQNALMLQAAPSSKFMLNHSVHAFQITLEYHQAVNHSVQLIVKLMSTAM